MRKIFYFIPFLTIIGLSACTEEAAVVPDLQDVTKPFMPAPDDQSEEAQLRREFYDRYGSFLLFNDTLQHDVLGEDVNGDTHYFTEVLELEYEVGMNTSASEKFTYTLLNDMESKRKALQYIEENILIHFSGKIKPFSWLLVDKINRKSAEGTISSPYAASGERAIVVACNMLFALNESQKELFTAQIMNTIISKPVNDNIEAFGDFLAISDAYYNGTFTDPGSTTENMKILNSVGFICRGRSYGKDTNGVYPDQELDLSTFARKIIANDAEKLQKDYQDYPLVLQKCDLMRNTLKALGYVE